MNVTTSFVLVAVVVLAIVAGLVFLAGGKRSRGRLTPLGSVAFACVLGGILFGENQMLGYGLLGVGVVLALVDMAGK